MAVHAQYPSNALLFNRDEQREMDSSMFDGVSNGNQRKRGRETSASGFQMAPTTQMNLFSSPAQSPALVSLAQLQQTQSVHRHPSLVSTGLRLSFEESNQAQNQWRSQFIQQDLASLIDGQQDELEQYLVAQGERLRRTLAGMGQKHYRALLAVAEASASRRLREREAELERGVRRAAELEDRIARMRAESVAWQAKAMADQATAASLHSQIQLAAGPFGPGAEDAESAHVDPERAEGPCRACRACRVSAVSVVLLPCRHLCLCAACDAAAGGSDAACCPVCHVLRTGSVQVFLS